MTEVLVIVPFRKPTFRQCVSGFYHLDEPIDSQPLVLCAGIRKSGYNVACLPFQNMFPSFNEQRDTHVIEELLLKYNPKVVLFSGDNFVASSSTAGIFGIRVISKILRNINLETRIGVVGRLATVLQWKLFDLLPDLDFFVAGESETIIGSVIGSLIGSDKDVAQFIGLRVSRKNQKLPCHFIENVDEIPSPDFALIKDMIKLLKRFRGINSRLSLSLRTSYGCVFKCNYCAGIPGWNKYRLRSKKMIERDVATFVNEASQYAELAFLEDEVFSLNVEHVREVCDVLKKYSLKIDALYTHVSLLNEEILALFAPVVKKVCIGFETCNVNLLKAMNKRYSLDECMSKIILIKQYGIKIHLELMIGIPGETVDDVLRDINFIYNLLISGLIDDVNTYVFCIHPGTEVWTNPQNYGIDFSENYDDTEESGGYPPFDTPQLSSKQIFVAYLISQLAIAEAKYYVKDCGFLKFIGKPNFYFWKDLFEKL